MPKTVTKNAREITSHRVNGLNEALRVFVIDEPGSGGANHEYVILQPLTEAETENLMNVPDEVLEWERYELPELTRLPGCDDFSLQISNDNASARLVSIMALAAGVGGKKPQGELVVEAFKVTAISFQNGPIKDEGVNGVSQEALIAVLIDRLEGFQSGKFKCHDNQVALDHLQSSRLWLHKRTMDRVSRGVEGTLKQ